MSVTRIGSSQRAHIDLATVRETLALIQDDLAREGQYGMIADAIGRAVAEIDAVAPPPKAAPAGRLAALFGSSFSRWTPES